MKAQQTHGYFLVLQHLRAFPPTPKPGRNQPQSSAGAALIVRLHSPLGQRGKAVGSAQPQLRLHGPPPRPFLTTRRRISTAEGLGGGCRKLGLMGDPPGTPNRCGVGAGTRGEKAPGAVGQPASGRRGDCRLLRVGPIPPGGGGGGEHPRLLSASWNHQHGSASGCLSAWRRSRQRRRAAGGGHRPERTAPTVGTSGVGRPKQKGKGEWEDVAIQRGCSCCCAGLERPVFLTQ